MLPFGSIGSYVQDAFAIIFVKLLDNVVYTILAVTYRIWVGITKLDLFGGSDAGERIYDEFSSRIYTVIAIVMVFIFAYRLLLYILDPGGKYMPKDKSGTIVKRTALSIVLVILAPIIFKYMSVFQYHVVANNTIPSIVLGVEGGNRYLDNGKQLAMITLMAFYHPVETNYNTFVKNTVPGDEDLSISQVCDQIIVPVDDLKDGCNTPTETCRTWRQAMYDWCNDQTALTPNKILGNADLRKAIGNSDGTEYMWIVCTACACGVIYFLVTYCISIGTRAVRLGFLEIIAPIPILLRMFDKSKFFDPWFKEIKKTYLELFLRIAIISFVIYMCTLVPSFIEMIAGAF